MILIWYHFSVKLITRDTDYAIRALCFISKSEGKRITVCELVKKLKIPQPFLRKLLQELGKKKVLKSHKGSRGGFLLAKPVNEIFLVDLMQVFQGSFELNSCSLKRKACPNLQTCALRNKINHIQEYVIRELKSVTIASLLKQEKYLWQRERS